MFEVVIDMMEIQKRKNNEARSKFTGSYKNKCVYHVHWRLRVLANTYLLDFNSIFMLLL